MTKPTQPSGTVSATVAPATASAGTDARIAHLEAENERLRANNERLLKAAYGLQDDVEALQQQRAELILKIERLRAGAQG